MDKQAKVSFQGVDNGLSSFMKKLQSDTKVMYGDFAKEAQKQTNSQKEQFKIIEQQIRALERRNLIEKEQNRIILERKRETGQITDKNFGGELAQLRAGHATDKVQTSILKDMLVTMKEQKTEEQKPATGRQVFNAVLIAGVVRDILSTFRQTATAQTGLDLITPFSGAAGALGGAAAGLFMSPGTVMAGREMGAFAGAAYTRHIRTQEEYERNINRYRAMTGFGESIPSLAFMGYSGIQSGQLAGELAGVRGGRVASRDLTGLLGLSRGFGIDEGAMKEAFGQERMGGPDAMSRIQRTLGLSIAEGLDRAKFTDAIKNQNQLFAQFAQTSTKVSDDRVNQIMFEFSRMGGMFKIGDPRAIPSITSINDSLANPGSGFNQAMNYAVLRGLPGGQSPWGMMKMQQKGIQTPGFLAGVLDQFSKMGMSDEYLPIMLQGRFNNLPGEAIDTLIQGWRKGDKLSPDYINKVLGMEQITGEAGKFTNKLTRYEAETSDAFRESMLRGVTTIATQFGKEMKEAIDDIADHLKEKTIATEASAPNLGASLGIEYGIPLIRALVDFNDKVNKNIESIRAQRNGK